MGNQGYSHDATRVAAEIIWSGEIGDVTEVHSFRGRASWPQGMPALPAPEKVPDTLDWDLWLGGAAMRPFTSGDEAYRKEYTEQSVRLLPAVQLARLLRFRQQPDRRLGHPPARPGESRAAARQPDQRRVPEAGRRPEPVHVPARRRVTQVGVRRAREHAAGHGLLVRHRRPLHAAGHDRRADARDPGHGSDDREPGGRRRTRRRGAGGPQARQPRRAAERSGAQAPAAQAAGARRRWRRRTAAGQRLQHRLRRHEGLPRHRRTRRKRRPAAGIALGGIQAAAADADAIARPSARLGPRVQGRRAGVLELRRSPGPTPSGWCSARSRRACEGKLLWDPKKMEFTNNREANKFVRPVFRKGWELKSLT